MCTPASFVVVKKGKDLQALWHKDVSDSHTDIIEYFDLKEQNVRGEVTLVCCEVVPPDDNYLLPIGQWKFKTDQDVVSNWYDAEFAEKVCRKELAAWKRAKIILPGKKLALLAGKRHIARVYGKIGRVSGEAKIGRVSGKAKIGRVSGKAKIGYVYDKAKIDSVSGEAKIDKVSGEAKIG